MKKSYVLILSIICAQSIFASTIKDIQFHGLKRLSKQSAANITGLQIGDEFNEERSNWAILNLYNQGYFKDIYVEDSDGIVVINLKEKPSIAKIDIEGVVTNDQKDIDKLIGIKKGQMYDELSIEFAKERIKQYYEAKGFFETSVDVKLVPLNSSGESMQVIFYVNRGENIIIDNFYLEGSKFLNYNDIEPHISNKKREFMGWLWGRNDGKLKIFELENDASTIKDLYMQKGFLDIEITEPSVNVYTDNYSSYITYYVNEGERYRLQDLDIIIPHEVDLNDKKTLKKLKMQPGKYVNSNWIRQDIEKIETDVANQGYAYAEIYPQTTKNDDDKTIDISYQIIPNEKVYIRNVSIFGNEKTADRIIRRELYLTEGNLYNKTDLRDSINALRRTGYFDDVEIKQNRVNDNEMDLEVVVKEAPTGSITGGIGYGSNDGLLLNAGVGDRNIFGTGLKGDIGVERTDDSLSGKISLLNPRIFDSVYSLGGTIYANDYRWDDYTEKSYGFITTVGRQLGRYTTISLSYNIEKSRISGIDEWYKAAGYLNGKNTKSSVTPAISFNNTDDYYFPRSGINASTSLEYAGLGGDIKFLKSRSNFTAYQGLKDYIDIDWILRFRANLGYMWATDGDEKIPINEKLFLGGMRSVRGYESRSIPKQNICIEQGCKWIETGGKESFNTSAELSFPLFDRLKMRGLVFFDYGMIGNKNFTEEKRYSTGVGIEWFTPIGPLQLYWSKPLNPKYYDDTSRFDFSIGATF